MSAVVRLDADVARRLELETLSPHGRLRLLLCLKCPSDRTGADLHGAMAIPFAIPTATAEVGNNRLLEGCVLPS